MELYSTYIETDKFEEVVTFYEKVFQKNGNVFMFRPQRNLYAYVYGLDRLNKRKKRQRRRAHISCRLYGIL